MAAIANISVIIPTLNEARVIQRTLAAILRQHPYEVIVSDGGSTDDTARLVQEYDVRIVQSARGRAAQMNAGAKVAQGDVYLFLHADTQLPEQGLTRVREVLRNVAICGGRFRGGFDIANLRYRVLAFYTRFPFFSYGDQAFFVRQAVFKHMQGFDQTAVFEDVDFFKRLRRKGQTAILSDAVCTSARRFQKFGFMKQKLINFWVASMNFLGRDPKPFLRRWYPDIR